LGGGKLSAVRAVLLDTCAAIWLMNGDPVSRESREAVSAAQRQNTGVFVSPISAWEIGVLLARNRIQLTHQPRAWFEKLLEWPGVRLAPMPTSVLIDSSFLPGVPPRDPADRIIAATARAYGYAVITRNRQLSDYAAAGHIDLIAC
jgi:PIN domain nuclease of toxin-antitoxin system